MPGHQSSRCWNLAAATIFAAATLTAESMPSTRQNALVQKYCAVCHTDAARNGGLSLEHFDASAAAPSLFAMMLSKLTGGVPLETVRSAPADAAAAALVTKRSKSGAVAAAGIPPPDEPTLDAWIRAFAVRSAGSKDWIVERKKDDASNSLQLTASILREMPPARGADEAESYRLIVSCDSATRQGHMQLTWSPVPRSGTSHGFSR